MPPTDVIEVFLEAQGSQPNCRHDMILPLVQGRVPIDGVSLTVAEVEAGLASSLERLVPSAGRTVVLASPPGTPDLQACATRFSSPDDCESEIDPVWYDVYEAEERVAEAAGATHIDTRGWFCHQGFCPAFVGNTAVYADGAHLTVEYAEQLGPVLREALRQSARGNRSAAD